MENFLYLLWKIRRFFGWCNCARCGKITTNYAKIGWFCKSCNEKII